MTKPKTTLKLFVPNRDGITLLFVISMVVLFLLMGTTFMIISNDYFKAARRRATLSTNITDPTALLDRCFYELFRGPALQDVQATLRGHSILEDQYGYGIFGSLKSIETVAGAGGSVVELHLDSTNGPNGTTRMLNPSVNPVNPANSADPENFFNGRYNGRVVSIVSGQFKGYSGRIISSFYATDNDLALQVLVDDNLAVTAAGNNARVIINGRDFSGFGSGNVTSAVNPDMAPMPLLGNESLRINRFGDSLADLRTNFLQFDNSPNEPYDIADYQNLFLGGTQGNVAFHRPNLIPAGGTDQQILATTLRPYFRNDGGNPSDFSTANQFFPSPFNGGPDVDTNINGVDDAVWIDIGLPSQTDSQGRLFRPLVAYRVLEMDSRLNLNAHGHALDASDATPPTFAIGSGYGPAEISLSTSSLARGVGGDYDTLMDLRYGVDDNPGYSGAGSLPAGQKLFGYPTTPSTFADTRFASAPDLLGRFEIATDVSGVNTSLPMFFQHGDGGVNELTTPISTVPYLSSFAIDGSAGDSPITALEHEVVLRFGDADVNLLTTKLNSTIGFTVDSRFYTPDSFEVNMPATTRSLSERLNDRLVGVVADITMRSNLINSLIPREAIFGGKINLNRPFGNGDDDDGDGIVDEFGEAPVVQATSQNGPSSFNTTNARFLMAKDLYISFLLATGDTVPSGFVFAGTTNANTEYHRMVAQWAVNVVDFRDADSINTPFRFDPTPFDGMAYDTTPNPNFTVWGCERPEILISETFAFHDRRNEDGAEGGMTTDAMNPDNDWDSLVRPVSAAILEFYNPWVQPTGFQRPSAEVGGTGGVNLGATTAAGDPVWRIALKRVRNEDNADIVRTFFFVDPGTSTARAGTDSFFPSAVAGNLQPGQYAVMKPVTGNSVNVGGSTTPLETITGIGGTISLFMDSSRNSAGTAVPNRTLSISDPAGGYSTPLPADQPLDASTDANRNVADLNALWVNGIADNFRVVYLQRLADPTANHNATTNPYLTVDTAGIDLLGMNTEAPGSARSNGDPGGENGDDGAGNLFTARNGFTQYQSVERGASFISNQAMATAVAPTAATITRARQNLFRAEDGPRIPASGFNNAAGFTHTFGSINDSYDDSAQAVANRTPFGWLSWNNRPFASHTELLNVPYTAPGLLTYLFNTESNGSVVNGGTHQQFRANVATNFGDSRYEHLLRFSDPLGGGAANANRFAHFLEFVETPSLFLGTETFLPNDFDHPNLDASNNLEFNPQVHGFPSFRVPGKINVNMVGQRAIWNNLTQGFPLSFISMAAVRDGGTGPTDFQGVFTTAENGLMVTQDPRGGGTPTLFSSTFDVDGTPATTSNPMNLRKDPAGSSYFGNELKQKLGNTATIRSSVYSIWIMVGYFEVDEYGRLGAELASDDGAIRRNRAFYVVDRSIPVACEPGQNHNVDKAVLTRSIIE